MEPTTPPPNTVTFFNLDNLLAGENILVIIGAWLFTELVKRVVLAIGFPEKGRIVGAVPALVPLIAAQVLLFIVLPWMPVGTVIGQRFVLGLVLGFASTHATLLLKRLGLGHLVEFVMGKATGKKGEDDEAADP